MWGGACLWFLDNRKCLKQSFHYKINGYGTVRTKTNSSWDDSHKREFFTGTTHPGRFSQMVKKWNKKFFNREFYIAIHCEYSNTYTIVADKIIFNIPDKKTALFNFLQNLLGQFTQSDT